MSNNSQNGQARLHLQGQILKPHHQNLLSRILPTKGSTEDARPGNGTSEAVDDGDGD